jgi:hypothetical protein
VSTLLAAAAEAQGVPRWGIFVDVEGAVSGFITAVILTVLTWYFVTAARAGRPMPEIRKLAGLDAIDEAIGRATEMGRSVFLANRTAGVGNVHSFALWGYMGYVAKLCAQYDTHFVNIAGDYLAAAVNEEVIKQAYLEAGRPDAFKPDTVRYVPGDQWAWTSAAAGMLKRERPAATMWIGYFYAESMTLSEVGAQIGAIQIAATTNTAQLPFFIASCDYTLIGEEEYAAGAYLSKEPMLTGTIVAEDVGKVIVAIVVLLGVIAQLVSPEANFVSKMLQF